MPTSFLPNKDSALLAWSLNFSTLISAGPVPLGLTAAMATAYASLHADFAAKLAACDPGVRNKAAVAAKNTARTALKDQARLLASIIQGQATVTDAQKLELGLTVRSQPSPQPAPDAAPAMDVQSVQGRTVHVRLHDANDAGRRGKPAGVAGATVFSFVGEEPPTDPAAWKFEGNTTRTTFAVVFPESVAPGTQVWLVSFWRNERDQSGPACTPISTNIQFGNSMAA